jgi:hypothetical protein
MKGGPMSFRSRRHGDDAVDLLESEDRFIKDVFARLAITEGRSVTQRSEHGNLDKQLVRRMAVREAARDHIAEVLLRTWLVETGKRLRQGLSARRGAMDNVEEMSRSIQGIYLNSGQDFDGAVKSLRAIVGPEIDWELTDVIPLIRRSFSPDERLTLFRPADFLRKHAPTNLSPDGPRWYEHAGLISRLIAARDHLRDYPRANRGQRV